MEKVWRLSGGKFARVLFLLIKPCLVKLRCLFAQRPTLRSAMSAFGLDSGTHLLIWAICASLQSLDVHKYVCGSQSCANRLI